MRPFDRYERVIVVTPGKEAEDEVVAARSGQVWLREHREIFYRGNGRCIDNPYCWIERIVPDPVDDWYPKRHPKRKKVGRKLAERLWQRSQEKCELRLPGCDFKGTDFHHRKLRSQGGRDTIDNGLFLCRPCHRWVHDHPGESYERGWLVRSHDDPALVPWLPL